MKEKREGSFLVRLVTCICARGDECLLFLVMSTSRTFPVSFARFPRLGKGQLAGSRTAKKE